jgi:hypothetical protein
VLFLRIAHRRPRPLPKKPEFITNCFIALKLENSNESTEVILENALTITNGDVSKALDIINTFFSDALRFELLVLICLKISPTQTREDIKLELEVYNSMDHSERRECLREFINK